MKKLFVLLLVSVLFASCGKDGKDGDVYLRFDWDWYVDAFEDNNPDTPTTISKDVDYLTKPGKFTFKYWCSDYYDEWYWEGTYEIFSNEGLPGGLIADGEDGDDNYYFFNMSGLSGATLTLTDTFKDEQIQLKSLEGFNANDYEKIPVGDVVEEIVRSTNGVMVIKKQLYYYNKK